jgi:hypothetical protein
MPRLTRSCPKCEFETIYPQGDPRVSADRADQSAADMRVAMSLRPSLSATRTSACASLRRRANVVPRARARSKRSARSRAIEDRPASREAASCKRSASVRLTSTRWPEISSTSGAARDGGRCSRVSPDRAKSTETAYNAARLSRRSKTGGQGSDLLRRCPRAALASAATMARPVMPSMIGREGPAGRPRRHGVAVGVYHRQRGLDG